MSQKVSVSEIEKVKRTMSFFSRYLRRDFLALIVKMVSKSLHIQTQRKDWRTRDGTFEFLARNWDKAYPLFIERTPINWFATRFDSLEKILCNRKFSMYLYYSWDKFKDTLIEYDFVKFLQTNSLLVMQAIETGDTSNMIFTSNKYGIVMAEIIDGFFNQSNNKMVTRKQAVTQPTEESNTKQSTEASPQPESAIIEMPQEEPTTEIIEMPQDNEQTVEFLFFDDVIDQDFSSYSEDIMNSNFDY